MKKLLFISAVSAAAVVIASCGDTKRERGSHYMPDMVDSRAYETYDDHSKLRSKGINYTTHPVLGTVSRGEELPYHLKNDSAGYEMSMGVTSPLPKLTSVELVEADRLYQINCAICHGSNLNGNGPLYKDGQGPYAAKPATLVGDPKIEAYTEGRLFHVQTYGKGVMGSYASQLTRKQRWMISQYIKTKQADAAGSAAPAKDSTATATAGGAGQTASK